MLAPFKEVSQTNTEQQTIKKPGLNKGSAGITWVPGLFSELFNVAASRPAQMTTPKDLVPATLSVKASRRPRRARGCGRTRQSLMFSLI
jgi:hypothetical protein